MFVLSTQRPEEGCCPEGVEPRQRCCAGRTISPRQCSPLNPARACTVTELVPARSLSPSRAARHSAAHTCQRDNGISRTSDNRSRATALAPACDFTATSI